MRMIPTRIHGVLDYLVGALLIVSPWLFGFADGGAQQWVPIVLGAGSGAILLASPWIFGFSDELKWPHIAIGIFEIAAALMTRTHAHSDDIAGVPGAARS